MADELSDGTEARQALVVFKDWKRPVQFASGRSEGNDTAAVIQAIKATFPEITKDAECRLQVKSEEWGGEYLDLPEHAPIPDRSTLKVIILEAEHSQVRLYMYLRHTYDTSLA